MLATNFMEIYKGCEASEFVYASLPDVFCFWPIQTSAVGASENTRQSERVGKQGSLFRNDGNTIPGHNYYPLSGWHTSVTIGHRGSRTI